MRGMIRRVGFSLLVIVGLAARADDAIETSGIKQKVVEPADADGDLLVSFKATVKNRTDSPQEVEVWIQGIDGEDFEVVEVQLYGRLGPKQTRVLTNSTYIREKTYSSVVKWQIEEMPPDELEDDFSSAEASVPGARR